jgi:hypothetical protein
MNTTEMTDKKYPFTPQELSELINKLPTIFPCGLVSIPPHDSTVEWASFYSGEEIFREVPERDLHIDEYGDTIVEKKYPKSETNKNLGEHLSIRCSNDPQFRIFDANDMLLPLLSEEVNETLVPIVALIKEYASQNIGEIESSNPDYSALCRPWKELRDNAIAWLSINRAADFDIYSELGGNLIEQELGQTNKNWLSSRFLNKLTFEGLDYSLTNRQWQTINILNMHSSSINGLGSSEIKALINENYSDHKIDNKFKVQDHFKKEKRELFNRLTQYMGKPNRRKYYLSVRLSTD